jgi:hypothetical protein
MDEKKLIDLIKYLAKADPHGESICGDYRDQIGGMRGEYCASGCPLFSTCSNCHNIDYTLRKEAAIAWLKERGLWAEEPTEYPTFPLKWVTYGNSASTRLSVEMIYTPSHTKPRASRLSRRAMTISHIQIED